MADLVILSGVPAAGKSTYCRRNLQNTHIVISLDKARSRSRELALLLHFIGCGRNVVVDNTNPTREDRSRYIALGVHYRYHIIGVQFNIDLRLAISRNNKRASPIDTKAIINISKKMVDLDPSEGFNEITIVNSNECWR